MTADHDYYGFTLAAPKHEWPFYTGGPGWYPTPITAASTPLTVSQIDFTAGLVDARVTGEATLDWPLMRP